MKPEIFQALVDNVKRNNPKGNAHLFPESHGTPSKAFVEVAAPKRIRQSGRPLLNKLEGEWFAVINSAEPPFLHIRAQAKRYKLANGAWYKPDMTATAVSEHDLSLTEIAWEVKGNKGKNIDRGLLALKFAAAAWPEVRFILVWKDKVTGAWQQQRVLP